MKEQFYVRNKFLYLYEMTSAVFGKEIERLVLSTGGDVFKKAYKRDLKKISSSFNSFHQSFDLFIKLEDNEVIRIEVKSNRASIKKAKSLSLADRAYKEEDFKGEFHFQQLKPGFSHVFVLVGICSNAVLYYVLNSDELKSLSLSPQHKGSGTRDVNDDNFEGQVFITMKGLEKYRCDDEGLLSQMVLEKYNELNRETVLKIAKKF